MQTHTDRRSPSQVKVGHRGGAEQGKVQALTRFFHALYWLHRMSVPKKGFNDGSTHPFASPSRIRHMTTRFPLCKTHLFSSQLYCPLQELKK